MKNSHLILIILIFAAVGLLIGHLASDRQGTAATQNSADPSCANPTEDASCASGNSQGSPNSNQGRTLDRSAQRTAAPQQRDIQAQRPTTPPQQNPKQAQPLAQISVGSQDPILGNPNAKVTLIEFSDFRCGYCGKLNSTVKELFRAYPNDLRIVFKHFPRNPQSDSFLAHMAAQEAFAQGKFWSFSEVLFSYRGQFTPEALVQLARDNGLDPAAMQRALENQTHRPIIESHIAQGRGQGVSATPTSFINGRLMSGAQPIENFKKIIDEELRR